MLDGYAGTGAVGIEALSRGAAHVTFVEQDPRAVALIEANLAPLRRRATRYAIIRAGFADAARGWPDGVVRHHLPRSAVRRDRAADALDAARRSSAPGTLLVVEHAQRRRGAGEHVGGAAAARARVTSGDSALAFYASGGGDALQAVTTAARDDLRCTA